jgi:xanthine dehydrogenase YagS FAD-binding subunit
MRHFTYQRAASVEEAVQGGAESAFLAGGTSLVDLMKLEVLNPARLIDVTRLDLRRIEVRPEGIRLGAAATNSEVGEHAEVRKQFPVLSEALLAGASPQLRNVATVAGNLMQRTRCTYYRDLGTPCNKRQPGSGCSALDGWTRMHAILGGSESCIALHPSDMCVALAALEAIIHVRGPAGERDIAFADFHLLPGDHPEREFALQPGELVLWVLVPSSAAGRRSRYVKVRDRASYAFALASCAAGLEISEGKIRSARLALGGVGTKPWRVPESEQALIGEQAGRAAFERAAAVALRGAQPRRDNTFKVELARRTAVRALTLAAEGA